MNTLINLKAIVNKKRRENANYHYNNNYRWTANKNNETFEDVNMINYRVVKPIIAPNKTKNEASTSNIDSLGSIKKCILRDGQMKDVM